MEFFGKENDFKSVNYEKLLNWMEKRADIFAFVTRTDIGINNYKKNLVKLLEPYLIHEERTNSWFLNMVKNYKTVGHVYYYKYNHETIEFILRHSDSLFDWGNNKKLPEDLTFLNKNKDVLLACNGHEFYYEVSEQIEKDFLIFKNQLVI